MINDLQIDSATIIKNIFIENATGKLFVEAN